MKIILYAMVRLEHQVRRAESFKQGLAKHGYKNVKILPHTSYEPSDLAVFWGMHHSNRTRAGQEKRKKDWLMMERGYVGNRMHWTAVGFNGLNGRAEFHNANSPADRWERFFPDMLKPWHDGEYVLITGQVPGDASIKNLHFDYQQIANEVRKYTNRPIHFRKHPHRLARLTRTPKGCITSPHQTLEQALDGAHVCITVNSNSGVDAVLAGTPVINIDHGSMVWELSGHSLKQVETPLKPDREQWAHNIAYAQWTPGEIAEGIAWDHLKQRYE